MSYGGPIPGPKPDGFRIDERLKVGQWYASGYRIRALCKCGAEREVPTGSIVRLFGANHYFEEAHDMPRLVKALVCGSCKERGKATAVLVKP